MTRALALGLLLAAAALGALFLAGDASAAATYDVTIQGSQFFPSVVDVNVGDTVRWTNNDSIAHTSRATGGHWDTGTIGASGVSASVTMQSAGTFGYVCAFHPGMTGTVRVTAAAENTPPSVTLASPAGGATVAGIVNVSGTVADPDADVLTVSLRFDAGSFSPVPRNGTSWSYAWDTRNVTNGAHTLTARVSDGKAITTSPTLSVTVNNPPTISFLGPDDGANATRGAIVRLTGQASVPAGALITVQVSLDGGGWVNATGRSLWSYAWDTAGLAPGDHTYQARVIDGVNEIETPTRVLTLVEPPPDEPPVLSIISPGEAASVSGLVNVSGTATDPEGAPLAIEADVDGQGWRPATGVLGSTWWYHWVPEGRPPGPFTILARATASNASTMLTRQATLVESPTALTIEITSPTPREGRQIALRVLSGGDAPSPVAGARLYLAPINGTTLHERTTNASGGAQLPALAEGDYILRAYGTGASGSRTLHVNGLYEYNATPMLIDFERVVPVQVSVRGDAQVRGLDVQLRGPILPGNVSGVTRTGNDGTALVGLQPLAAGELAVFVDGNDTGVRVRIAPTVRVEWSPPDPHPGDVLVATLRFNDLARTPAADANLSVELPGEARVPMRADAQGRIELRPSNAGTLRLLVAREDGLRSILHLLSVSAPPATPELEGLATRAGPALLQMSAIVRNVGEGPGSFTIDGVATSSAGTARQGTARTAVLDPGAQERITIVLNVGVGEYDVIMSVRNSTQSLTATALVLDSGVPPTPTPATSATPGPTPGDAKDSPGAALGAVLPLVVVAALARRRAR